MSSPQIFDIEALLAPISGENPGGESLRYTDTYDAIEDARRADDTLDQGEWQREAKAADWRAVVTTATDALATKSKDLQIAVWLTEAAVKQYGFPGLRDSLRVLRELQVQFWDSLYPEIEDEDLEFRTGPLEWLNEKLPTSVRAIPVVQAVDGGGYSWLHWKESREVDNLGRQSQEALAEALADGKVSGEQFDKAVAAASRAYYETLFEDINQTLEEYAQLDRVLDERFGREAPSLLSIKQAIEDCRVLVEGILKKKRELEPDPIPSPTDGARPEPDVRTTVGAERAAGSSAAPTLSGNLPLEPLDRADALRRLAAVAAFFRRTEPHSPVSYLVQRAVRWGEMPLEEWLREVINEEGVLTHVRETLGLKNSESSE